MALHVQLPKFEGPLGLLLYLIRKEEMDIFDINIVEITRQYLDAIQLMKDLDLEVAGEFVAMAATLIHIKSKMLLPQYNELGEEIEAEDPRRELVQKLLEYEKFQEASKLLYERPLLGRDIWARSQKIDFDVEEEVVLDEGGLFSLISAYRTLMRAMAKKIHHVAAKGQSIAGRILEIRGRFRVGERIRFTDLFRSHEGVAQTVLITFLSILELSKLGFISLFQSEPLGMIYIDTKKDVEGNVISQVEEFDSRQADQVIDHIMEDAQAEHDHQMREESAFFGHASGDDEFLTGETEQEEAPENELIAPATDEEIFAAEMEDLGKYGESIENVEKSATEAEDQRDEIVAYPTEMDDTDEMDFDQEGDEWEWT